MKWNLIATVSLTLLFSSAPLLAAEYYVAKTGNDSAPGTLSRPWKTIAKANSTLAPGDTVYIRSGEYHEVIRPLRSGTVGRMITYQAHPGDKPVITNSLGRIAIVLENRSYIAIDGLTVTGKQPWKNSNLKGWVQIHGGGYNIIRNSDFQYATGWAGIELDKGTHHNKIINNRMDYVGTWDDGSGQDVGNTINIECAYRNLVEGNTLTRGGHNLLLANGYNNVIRDNIFDNKWGANTGQRGATITSKSAKGCANKIGYNVFEGNIVRNTLPASDDPVNTAQIKVEGIGHIVRRNFILNGHNLAINTSARDEIPISIGNKIYNNVLYGHGGSLWDMRMLSGGTENDHNVFKNNVAYKNRLDPPRPKYDVDFLINTRLKHNQIIANAIFNSERASGDITLKSVGTNTLQTYQNRFPANFAQNIIARPEFVASDPKVPADFRLSASSPLIDMGASLTTTSRSGSGTVIAVEDAGYFFDGFDIVEGDSVQVGSNAPVRVIAVDYDNNKITIEKAISWRDGDAVNLPYSGAALDIGAHEYTETNRLATPSHLKIIIQ